MSFLFVQVGQYTWYVQEIKVTDKIKSSSTWGNAMGNPVLSKAQTGLIEYVHNQTDIALYEVMLLFGWVSMSMRSMCVQHMTKYLIPDNTSMYIPFNIWPHKIKILSFSGSYEL